jgi:hypothetical protein
VGNLKLFLAYTNPLKQFDEETSVMINLQIDNSLELGWKTEDIYLYLNFDYEYNGVKAVIVDDFCIPWGKESNKILVIDHLLKNNLLEKGLYWYHDFDVYQNAIITEEELEMDGYDLGLTSYIYKKEWNCGSFFFRETAGDIFALWAKRMFDRERPRVDEKTLFKLIDQGLITGYKELNATYNIVKRDVAYICSKARKPYRALHFHPYDTDPELPKPLLDTFMYGKNKFEKPIMSERLINLFHKYGIK